MVVVLARAIAITFGDDGVDYGRLLDEVCGLREEVHRPRRHRVCVDRRPSGARHTHTHART